MKKNPFIPICLAGLALAITCVSLSCSKISDECFIESRSYEFFEDASLALDTVSFQLPEPSKIKAGERLVFQFLRTTEQKESCQCADCGEGDWVVFEVDSDVESFSLALDNFKDAKVNWLTFSGFAGGFHSQTLTGGKVSGEKLDDDEWRIDLELQREVGEPLKFKKAFKLNP